MCLTGSFALGTAARPVNGHDCRWDRQNAYSKFVFQPPAAAAQACGNRGNIRGREKIADITALLNAGSSQQQTRLSRRSSRI